MLRQIDKIYKPNGAKLFTKLIKNVLDLWN